MTRNIYALPATFGLLCAGAIALEAPERPQDDRARPTADQDTSEAKKNKCFAKLDEISGMDLWTREGEDETDLGDFNDFLVDAQNGKITHAIISSGGVGGVGDTLRALPCEKIKWIEDEDGERKAYVDLSEDEFDGMAEFEEENADRLVQEARNRADASGAVAREGSGRTGDSGTTTASARMLATSQMYSNISELDVYEPNGDEAVTSIGSIYVDTDRNAICFMTVEIEDATYVVPFESFKLRVTNRDEAESVEDLEYAFVAPRAAAQMEGAPTMSEDEDRTVTNPKFVRSVYAFYGVEDPREGMSSRSDAMRDRAKSKDAEGGRDSDRK